MSIPTTNLVLWLRADAGVYKDTAGTTPATADGDPVALWQDQSGHANHVSQATAGNRPALKLGVINGKPTVRFSQASTHRLATAGSVAMGIGAGDFWACFVWQVPNQATGNNFHTALSIGAYSPAFYLPLYGTSGGTYRIEWYMGGGHDFTLDVSEATFYLTEVLRASGTAKKYQSSAGAAPALDAVTFALAASIADAAITVGWDTSSADAFNGDLAEVLLYTASLNATDQASLESALRAKYWNTGPGAGRPFRPIGSGVVNPRRVVA